MDKKVLIAGFPKSGNTWLGYMLSYLLGAKYVELEAPDSKVTLQKEILGLIDGSVSRKTDYAQVCKTHQRYHFMQDASSFDLDSFDKVILVVRDPRDVAVSYYYYKYYNIPIAMNTPQKMLSQKSWLRRSIYWKRHVVETARQWTYHTVAWRSFEGMILIKYEDLLTGCVQELKKICTYLDVPVDDAQLEEVVKRFSFEKLSGGRKAGQEYQTAFFRKGISGDYRGHFDFFDTMIMKRYAGKEMESLGYR